jgi:hypothetical protein
MMRTFVSGVSAAAMLLLSAAPALPQETLLPIATVTCGDLAKADPAYQAALVYYAAGYRDGVNYARAATSEAALADASSSSIPVVTPSAPPSDASSATSSSASAEGGGTNSATIGGLTLQAQEVITACAASPDVLLTEIISNHGGARGVQASPSAVGVPAASSPMAGASQDTSAASAASAANPPGGASAVQNDLGAASTRLQQNIGTPPGGAAPATPIIPGATGATATPGAATSP